MKFFVGFVLFIISSVGFANKKTYKVATLEWPPFVCTECPGQGIAASALKKALASQNIDIVFEFMSWSQAIRISNNPEFLGYFPAWDTEFEKGFIQSQPLFESPLGFVERKDNPIQWQTLKDLKGLRIGGAKDYRYPTKFLDLAGEGFFKFEIVVSDDTNLRKLAQKKLDAVIIDKNNAAYLIKKSSSKIRRQLAINPKVLETKNLYIMLNKKHEDIIPKINLGITTTNTKEIVQKNIPNML
ncbi:MAG: substrate-binding periplasmic protein [Bdellovibrionia bacterium]